MKNEITNLITLLSAAGVMCISAGAVAAGNKHNVADLNNDNMITSEEVLTYVQMNYKKINENNDDRLNTIEAAELEEIFDIDG